MAYLFLILAGITILSGHALAADYNNLMKRASHVLTGQYEHDVHSFGTLLLGDSNNAKFQDHLWSSFGAPQSLNGQVSPACVNATNQLKTGVQRQELWALSMVDATTKIESGILQGNVIWPGDFSQCRDIVAYNYSSGEAVYMFGGKHCTLVISNISNIQPIIPGTSYPGLMVGVCLPDVCTDYDSLILVNNTLAKYLPPTLKEFQPVSIFSHAQDDGYPLDNPAIGVISMLAIIAAILAFATLYDIIVIQSGLSKKRIVIDEDEADIVEENDAAVQCSEEESKDGEIRAITDGERGRFPMLMIRMSMYSNAVKILNVERSQASLDCIHGIRFLSMTWVILGHSYSLGMGFTSNPLGAYNYIKGFAFQALFNATVSVDTFFLLSGTLVSYLLLRELHKKGGPRNFTAGNWVMFYFHRFWRLTPPYMIILGVHTALYKYMGTGPLWSDAGIDPDCSKSWWANLLYLNNLIPNHKSCMGWAWYLANDMQFYVISPLFIVSLYMHKIVGLVLCFAGLLGTTVATAVITQINNFPGGLVLVVDATEQNNYMNDIYIVPWCRFGPYVVGILLGYLLFKTNRKVVMKWYLVLLMWAAATAMAMAVLYGQYGVVNGHPDSTPVNALYGSLNRTVWAVAVAWVIFACVSGLGGPVNHLLSWSALVPLSRLTYMAYLIHPVVIIWYFNSRLVPVHFDNTTEVYIFLGNLCVSYGAAFVGSLAFEAPMMGLEKTIFWKRNSEK